MENYTEFLKEYLKGRRNISKKLYTKGNRFYRAIQKGKVTLENVKKLLNRNNQNKKVEYKVTKDKDFIGKRFESDTVEKIITYANGEVEKRIREFIPVRDGDINKIDLDTLKFPKSITSEEWEQLSPEYHKAWINGNMTEELCKELHQLRKEGSNELY